jgi:hypothetical protein
MDNGCARKKGLHRREGREALRQGRLYGSLGERRELMRRAKDKTHARELKKQLVKQLENSAKGIGEPNLTVRE